MQRGTAGSAALLRLPDADNANAAQEAAAREQVHHHAPSHQHHGGGQVRQID